MSNNDQMPKVDFSKDKLKGLKNNEINFMKIIEAQNLERVKRFNKIRRNNIITGSIIGSAVLGIYFYSMFAVKQERFLDDFNEPEKVSN